MQDGARFGLLLRAFLVAGAGAILAACSLLLDWSGYTSHDAGTGSGGGGSVCGADHICVMPPTSDWKGPMELYEGPLGDPLPSCGPGYSVLFEGRDGLVSAPASCSPCSCSDPQGGRCTDPPLAFYTDNNCTMPCDLDAGALSPMACVSTSGCAAFQVGAPNPADLGACMASGGTATYDAGTTWSRAVRACTAVTTQSASCSLGMLCAATPAAHFKTSFCIMKDGDVACPQPSPYSVHLLYGTMDGVVDTRACTACNCGAPIGASCSFAATRPALGFPGSRYLDSNCVVPDIPFGVPSGCSTGLTTAALKLVISPVLDGGHCSPSGGQPGGGVAPVAVETFCCTTSL